LPFTSSRWSNTWPRFFSLITNYILFYFYVKILVLDLLSELYVLKNLSTFFQSLSARYLTTGLAEQLPKAQLHLLERKFNPAKELKFGELDIESVRDSVFFFS
jgi:hypothetical protein